ncbi:MAG: AI-2E family transporter [Deltaproteobacteria bacterium]|nr:AI-2E family transporter [Deltaproteobacteria bacterium]
MAQAGRGEGEAGRPRGWALAGLLALALTVLLLYYLASLVVLVIFAFFLAYLLNPMVRGLERMGVPRTLGIFIIFLFVLLVLSGLGFLAVTFIEREGVAFQDRLPAYVEAFRQHLLPRAEQLLGVKLPETIEEALVEGVRYARGASPDLPSTVSRVLARAFSSTVSFLLFVFDLLIVPVVAFYFLQHMETVGARVLAYLPPAWRPTVAPRLAEINLLVGEYLRGAVVLALALAVLYSLGLSLVGIDMAVAIGVLTGLLSVVPYVGALTGFSLASVMALITFGDLPHLLGVAAVFAAVIGLESVVLTPKLVGEKVGLHPVVTILAVLAGGKLFGFLGILLAVPTAAVLNVGARTLLELYRASPLFLGVPVGNSWQEGGKTHKNLDSEVHD